MTDFLVSAADPYYSRGEDDELRSRTVSFLILLFICSDIAMYMTSKAHAEEEGLVGCLGVQDQQHSLSNSSRACAISFCVMLYTLSVHSVMCALALSCRYLHVMKSFAIQLTGWGWDKRELHMLMHK